MFGGPLDPPPKPKVKPRPDPEYQDNLITNVHPYHFGHLAREPNSDYKVKLMQYKQRQVALENESICAERTALANECYTLKFLRHTDKRRFQYEIRSRVQAKLKEYDEAIEKRRERLKELLAKEEREFCRETVENLQRGGELKMAAMKEKVAILKSQREAQRLEVVRDRKIQQYLDRCEDLRPALEKKHLIESKQIQLQQMRENESRREADKELDKMWANVSYINDKEKMDREQQEALDKHIRQRNQEEIWQIQIKGKELAKQEAERNKKEDLIELRKIDEELKKERLEALEAERKKKLKIANELLEQIKFQEKILAERTKAEKDLDDAFTYLSQLEYEREKNKVKNVTQIAKREMQQYRSSLAEIDRQRKEEEKQLILLLDEYRKDIEKKQDAARCKLQEAKEKMRDDVLAGRAAQLQHKKQEAEEQLKAQQAESELLRLAYQTNQRLNEEAARLRAMAAQEYSDDLKKQIEYNNELRVREKQELERQLEAGRIEEEKYTKLVKDIIAGEYGVGAKHPFRRVLEQYDCQCPTINPKY